MKSEWTKMKLSDIADFNPRETIKKGEIAKKISMDVLRPFYRDVPYYTEECFSGGTKFRNGDTIMARITPCLENGKTAQVSILNDGEVGFGSTEYIVFRAKEGIADKNYLLIDNVFIINRHNSCVSQYCDIVLHISHRHKNVAFF